MKNTTRSASDIQEKRVARKFDAYISSNSGASKFNKGDIQVKDASLLIECKTCMSDKESFSIKKEWLKKLKDQAFAMRLDNYCLAFNFNFACTDDYYIINDKLMNILVEHLKTIEK